MQGSVPLAGRLNRAPVGTAAVDQLLVLAVCRDHGPTVSSGTHHRHLGFGRITPYSAVRGKKSVTREALDELKQQIPLLDYLRAQDWRAARRLSRGRWMGLCPLHGDRKPSFMVDPNQGLFYCYGCGRGGDVIRFCRTLSPAALSASLGVAPSVARPGAATPRNDGFL